MAKINRKKQIRNLALLGLALAGVAAAGFGLSRLGRTKDEPNQKQDQKEERAYEPLTAAQYAKANVNELGNVPIMMYHGIQNMNNADTAYTGGNIDVDGYQRTAEAFRNDLRFYYDQGYRMIRLSDYVDGNVDVEPGKSPLILTFDDGLDNNILVTGLDKDGNIEIDPNSAVGILEAFKKEHPDMNVTATFFVNQGLFSQPEYNEKILKWLVEHGYDVGNHTMNHPDFLTIDQAQTEQEVGGVYEKLEEIIPGKYVPIVALPFGSPYDLEHPNMASIFQGTFNGKPYTTKSTLQVAWEADASPYSNAFNPTFLKRIRAYDNNGENFDIQMNFDRLNTSRYISDGDPDTIVYPESEQASLGETYEKKPIPYTPAE